MFWFGLIDDGSCLRVKPLPVGPSWTLGDESHDCTRASGTDITVEGHAAGTLHRDGSSAPPTGFSAVSGRVSPSTARVDIVWTGGRVVTTVPDRGRFFLVWAGTEHPTTLVARSAKGRILGSIALTKP